MLSLAVGECYFIRTFGAHWVGRVRSVTHTECVLEDAAWVSDSGRLGVFIATGKADGMEVERVGVVTVPLAYVSDYMPWPHKLFDKSV